MTTNKTIKAKTFLSLLGLAALLPPASSYGAEPEHPKRVDLHVEAVTATVKAVDHATRAVTLVYEDGAREELIVGPEVKRLDEVEVGDTVAVDYVTALGLELRKPTAAEIAEPLVVLQNTVRAPGDVAPAGAVGREIRAIATVEILDRIHKSATLVGPNGNRLTIAVREPERLTQVRIGDTVAVTYTEAVVVSLEKLENEDAK